MRNKIAPFLLLTIALTLTAYGQDAPKSYIGAGFGIGHSTSDFKPKPKEVFGVGQKTVGRIRLRFIAGIRSQPQLPTLFQEGAAGYEQNGYEIFARPEADVTLVYLGPVQGFVGGGLDYFHQRFPGEPGGKKAHFHSGLNPLLSGGATFNALGGSHRIAGTRIFQEFKAREFDYMTAYKPGSRLIALRHKGTLNPSYLEGWRLRYEHVRRVNKKLSLYFAGEGSYYKLKEFPNRGFGDSYYEREAVLNFQAGVVF